MTSWNTNFAGTNGIEADQGYYSADEYGPAGAYPISYPSNTYFGFDVSGGIQVNGVWQSNYPFTLACSFTNNFLQDLYANPYYFPMADVFPWPSKKLPTIVTTFPYANTLWTAQSQGMQATQSISLGDTVYQTLDWIQVTAPYDTSTTYPTNWGTSEPTQKRTIWAVNVALNATTADQVTVDIFKALTTNSVPMTGYGDPRGPALPQTAEVWTLMDGKYEGRCDQLSALMAKALDIHGINQSSIHYVRAQPTNLKNVEAAPSVWMDTVTGQIYPQQTGNAKLAYLLMDFKQANFGTALWAFPGDSVYALGSWNNYEGCINVGGLDPSTPGWFSLWPANQVASNTALFQTLPFNQYWCITTDGKPPSLLNYQQILVGNPIPKPLQ